MDGRIEDLQLIKKIFAQYGVEIILVYGALLGWYRDKDFLPGDDDIDLAVIQPVDYKTRKRIGWKLYNLGFNPQAITFNVFGQQEIAEMGYNGDEKTGIIVCQRNIKFTIFFFYKEPCKQHGEEYVCIPKMGAVKLISSPTKFYNKLGEIKVGKEKYLTPSPIEDYLAFTYFNAWKDKNDRRHGDTYFAHHSMELIEDVDKKTDATLWK